MCPLTDRAVPTSAILQRAVGQLKILIIAISEIGRRKLEEELLCC